MIIAGLHCTECGDPELVAVWPGGEGDQREMFEVMKCWCEWCWLKSFGPKTALPRRGSRAKSAALAHN